MARTPVGRRRGPVGAGGLPRGVVPVVFESLQGRRRSPTTFSPEEGASRLADRRRRRRRTCAAPPSAGDARRASAPRRREGRGGSRAARRARRMVDAPPSGVRVAPAGRVDPGCPAGGDVLVVRPVASPADRRARDGAARGARGFRARPRARWCLRRCARGEGVAVRARGRRGRGAQQVVRAGGLARKEVGPIAHRRGDLSIRPSGRGGVDAAAGLLPARREHQLVPFLLLRARLDGVLRRGQHVPAASAWGWGKG